MKQEIAKMLKQDMSWALDLRGELIKNRLALMETAMESADQTTIYRHLSELSKLTETLCRELREAMTTFFSDLQLVGVFPELIPFPNGGEVTVTIDGDCLKLELPALLPFSAGGSVYYHMSRSAPRWNRRSGNESSRAPSSTSDARWCLSTTMPTGGERCAI